MNTEGRTDADWDAYWIGLGLDPAWVRREEAKRRAEEREKARVTREARRRQREREGTLPLHGTRHGGDDIGYNGAHHRAHVDHGGKPCAHCGATEGLDMALSHDAPEENLRTDRGRSHRRGMAFSLSTADYIPLCRTCHNRYDRHVGSHP